MLCHISFLPSQLLGRPKSDTAMQLIRNLLAWGAMRSGFVGERLPWLDSAAASRYPDDEPPAVTPDRPRAPTRMSKLSLRPRLQRFPSRSVASGPQRERRAHRSDRPSHTSPVS